MANFFGILAVLTFIAVCCIGYFNPIENFYVTVGLIYVFGLFTGVFLMYKGLIEGERYARRVSTKLDKQIIAGDEAQLKVKTLENKVKSLESALDKALNKDG